MKEDFLRVEGDDLWARQDDTEDFKKMRLLIGHKPSIVESLAYIAAQVERERAEAPWWKKILRPFI